jgi:hypothetical protein
MLFINNKYTTWYYAIIESVRHRAIDGYSEKHHIIPKSLKGDDSPANLIRLTAREHFLCHRLLTKMTEGDARIKMLHALGKFIQCSDLQQRNFTARQYNVIRKAIIDARTGIRRPGIGGVKKGTIPWNKGKLQGSHSNESNQNRSTTMKNKPNITCPHCGKIGKGNVMHRYHFTNCKDNHPYK